MSEKQVFKIDQTTGQKEQPNFDDFNVKTTFEFDNVAFNVAALTANAVVFQTTFFGEKIYDVFVDPTDTFVGTLITDLKCTIGVTGDEARYAPSFDIDQDANEQDNENDDVTNVAGLININIYLTAVGADLEKLTAGSVTIYIRTKEIFRT